MPRLILPALGALVLGALAFTRSSKAGAAPSASSEYLDQLHDSRSAGQPMPHTPQGVFIYQWARGAAAGTPTALDFVRQSVRAGYVVWADVTLTGQDRFYLSIAKPGVRPAGHWFVIADRSTSLPGDGASPLAPGGRAPGGGGVPIDIVPPTPPGGVPINTPRDAAQIPGAPAPTAPATPSAPVAPATSGYPEVDNLIASGEATPYQLREIASELRKVGKPSEAEYVERKAADLYASLRVSHKAIGGTPFQVRDHHGNGVSGHLPANVARHYGGTVEELAAANPTKKKWGGWVIGSKWLLPLAWNAEAKAPPPIAGMSKAAAAPKAAVSEVNIDVNINRRTGKTRRPGRKVA